MYIQVFRLIVGLNSTYSNYLLYLKECRSAPYSRHHPRNPRQTNRSPCPHQNRIPRHRRSHSGFRPLGRRHTAEAEKVDNSREKPPHVRNMPAGQVSIERSVTTYLSYFRGWPHSPNDGGDYGRGSKGGVDSDRRGGKSNNGQMK